MPRECKALRLGKITERKAVGNGVAKLAHIAGPIVSLEMDREVFGKGLLGERLPEHRREESDVANTFAERR